MELEVCVDDICNKWFISAVILVKRTTTFIPLDINTSLQWFRHRQTNIDIDVRWCVWDLNVVFFVFFCLIVILKISPSHHHMQPQDGEFVHHSWEHPCQVRCLGWEQHLHLYDQQPHQICSHEWVGVAFLLKICEARPWWWGFLLFHTSCHDVVTICVQTLLSVMVFVLQWPRHYTDSGSAHLHHSHQGHKCVLSRQRMPPSSSQHWPHWIPLQTGSYKPQIWRGAIKVYCRRNSHFLCMCLHGCMCVCVHRQEYMREYWRWKKQDSIDLLLFHHFQLFLVLRMCVENHYCSTTDWMHGFKHILNTSCLQSTLPEQNQMSW